MPQINRALPRTDEFKMNILDYSQEKDIVSYKVVDKLKKTGEGDDDYILEKEVVEASRENRQKRYDLEAQDHDLYAIIKKVTETGDTALINKHEGVFIDVSNLPENNADLNARLENAVKVWKALPDDLKQGMTLGQFVDAMTDDKLNAYLKSKTQPSLGSTAKSTENPVEKVEENVNE